MTPAADIRREVSRLFRPPKAIAVSDAGKRYVRVRSPSGGALPWDPSVTPYMVEPMRCLTSRLYEAVIFVGPAQSGKTQALVDCWVGWQAMADPSDMMILQTSQETARDFSKRRIDRLHRYSPEIGRQLSRSPQQDNTYDKIYRAGNILTLAWPSINQLSGRPIKLMALTDYDRMPEDVDNEGSPFALAQKRTTTFLSRAMTLVESSPGYDILDPKWRPKTPHEAPPTKGILALFNLGDRRRFYWPCQHCKTYFLQPPGPEGLSFDVRKDKDGRTIAKTGKVGVPCPNCGAVNEEKHRRRMIARGEWRAEANAGEFRIASFWLPGAAAAYTTWRGIARKFVDATREHEITGSEEALKNVTNLDFGAPYLPLRMQSDEDPDVYQQRAEDLPKRLVPEGVRYLVAAVDVQRNRFVVQVMGYGVDGESWVVDRYDIALSDRLDRGEPVAVDPAGRAEDWDLVYSQVIHSTYPLSETDTRARAMRPIRVMVDSGGAEGVTDRAYRFYRRCKRKGEHGRLMLVKGERPGPQARRARVTKTYPDNTRRSDRKARVAGDVPVFLLNTTALKDSVHADLARGEPGPGFIHFPDWLPPSFYDELAAERRTARGWDLVLRSKRNEALDLLCYAKAGAIALGAEKINWSRPPPWAQEWDKNSNISSEKTEKGEKIADNSMRRRRKTGFVNRWR